MARLAVIGAGMMGEALARGLLAAGWTPSDLILADVRTDRLDVLAADLGVGTAGDNAEAASKAEAVLLAVKPQDAPAALESLRHTGRDLGIVSIVAGLRTQEVEERVGSEPSVVRAMPNTPARVGKGVTALTRGRYTLDATAELASAVFSTVGPVVWTAEHHLDAVTALSGSGPAYVFLVAEAMVEAGVALGLPRDVAETLTYATIEGSGRMLVETGEHPAALRGQVTSPGGTTAAALSVLEAMAVRAAFGEAIRAAQRRSRELGAG
jgi:pyrroline-5-carboxylate reductase